jgi:hypothetical protein
METMSLRSLRPREFFFCPQRLELSAPRFH